MQGDVVLLRESVEKVSKLSIINHRRMLELRKDIICYYNKVYNVKDPQKLQYIYQNKVPKAGVRLQDIKLNIESNQKCNLTLAFSFPQSCLLTMEQLQKIKDFRQYQQSIQLQQQNQTLNQFSQQKFITWIFYFDRPQSQEQWIKNINNAQEDLRMEQQYGNNINEEINYKLDLQQQATSKQQQFDNINRLSQQSKLMQNQLTDNNQQNKVDLNIRNSVPKELNQNNNNQFTTEEKKEELDKSPQCNKSDNDLIQTIFQQQQEKDKESTTRKTIKLGKMSLEPIGEEDEDRQSMKNISKQQQSEEMFENNQESDDSYDQVQQRQFQDDFNYKLKQRKLFNQKINNFLMKEQEKKRQLEDEEKKQRETQEQMKLQAEERERREKQSRELQAEEHQKRKILIESAFEFQYVMLINEYLNPDQDFNSLMENGVKLYLFLGQFRKKAVEAVKDIVDDLLFQGTQYRRFNAFSTKSKSNKNNEDRPSIPSQQMQNIDNYYSSNQQQQDNVDQVQSQLNSESVFYLDGEFGLIIKLGWVILDNISIDGQEINLYTDKSIKNLGDSFRINNFINNQFLAIKKEKVNYCIRVPFTCIVEYKGFKALVTARPPYENNIQYGLIQPSDNDKQPQFKEREDLKPDLQLLAEKLNIKPHTFTWNPSEKPVNIILSYQISIHEGNDFQQLKDLLKQFNQPDQSSYQKKQKNKAQELTMKFFYIENVKDVLAINCDLEAENLQKNNNNNSQIVQKRLRPEFIQSINFNLNPDALEDRSNIEPGSGDELELYVAGKVLKQQNIVQIIQYFEALDIVPIDSFSLKQNMHFFGLNMKYLGYIASNTFLPNIQDICKQEMIARVLKKMIRHYISDKIFQQNTEFIQSLKHQEDQMINSDYDSPIKVQGNSMDDDNEIKSKSNQGQMNKINLNFSNLARKVIIQQKNFRNHQMDKNTQIDVMRSTQLAKLNKEIREYIVVILNLVFGVNKDSQNYWQIINKQVQYDFNYKDTIKQSDINLGGLLNALVYHCNLDLKLDLISLLGKLGRPSITHKRANETEIFTIENILGMQQSSDVYDLDELEIKQISGQSDLYLRNGSNVSAELTIKAQLLQLCIARNVGCSLLEECTIMLDLAESYLQNQSYKEAKMRAVTVIDKLQEYPNVQLARAYVVLLKVSIKEDTYGDAEEYYKKAINLLQFNLGHVHPFYENLFMAMADYYIKADRLDQAELLISRDLVECMVQCLGTNHRRTGSIYAFLASIQVKLLKKEEALRNYELSYYIFEANYGPKSLDFIGVAECLIPLYFEAGKFIEALKVIDVVLLYYIKNEAQYVDKLAYHYMMRANILLQQQNYKDCLSACESIWQLCERQQINKIKQVEYLECVFSLTTCIYFKNIRHNLRLSIFQFFEQQGAQAIKNKNSSSVDILQAKQQSVEHIKQQILNKHRSPYKFVESIFNLFIEIQMNIDIDCNYIFGNESKFEACYKPEYNNIIIDLKHIITLLEVQFFIDTLQKFQYQ